MPVIASRDGSQPMAQSSPRDSAIKFLGAREERTLDSALYDLRNLGAETLSKLRQTCNRCLEICWLAYTFRRLAAIIVSRKIPGGSLALPRSSATARPSGVAPCARCNHDCSCLSQSLRRPA